MRTVATTRPCGRGRQRQVAPGLFSAPCATLEITVASACLQHRSSVATLTGANFDGYTRPAPLAKHRPPALVGDHILLLATLRFGPGAAVASVVPRHRKCALTVPVGRHRGRQPVRFVLAAAVVSATQQVSTGRGGDHSAPGLSTAYRPARGPDVWGPGYRRFFCTLPHLTRT